MLSRIVCSLALIAALVLPARAADDPVAQVVEVLRLPEVIAIMQQEGRAYGDEIGETLLGPRAGSDWQATVADLYDAGRMTELFAERFEPALVGRDAALDEILAFFGSPAGQRLIELEISARRAMLDEAVDAAARDRLAEMQAAGDLRLRLLRDFADANDLIEENVVGGMNATFAFYMGLQHSGAEAFDLNESEILADVWSQEPDIRAELEDWLFSFLALAYGPLDDAELADYIAFSQSPAGQTLNLALFAGFNAMFESLSRDLGREAGQILTAEDI